MSKPKLLIVEDDENVRTQMKWALAQDYDVSVAGDRQNALLSFQKDRPGVVTLDLGLPPDTDGVQEGFLTLSQILEYDSLVKVIVITGRDEKEHALAAIENGAYDFFCKPVEVEDLKIVLRRALHVSELERENRKLQEDLSGDSFQGILGTSPQMQEVFDSIRKVAGTDASIILLGESGTGKELAARAVHRLSKRSKNPFVAINCGAIPETLLESELFGHEKGSFTGAHIQKKGHIELAQGGTLFLDEIGDLPFELQVKLLRFLQEGCVIRIGGREEIKVDVRILAATNQDLQKAMQKGLFREDLYFRLGVVTITLPPLRDRQGDIELLAKAFLQKYAQDARKKITGFTSQALRVLCEHSWSGNVRELENRIRRAVIMAEGKKVTPKDMELSSPTRELSSLDLKEARDALEKELVQQALEKTNGNMTRAATELGISRPTLYELLDKLGIER